MGHYTKKPVTIEAFRWTGGPEQGEDPVWASDAVRDGVIQFVEAGFMAIQTTEGLVNASPGDWVIRGVEGEIYPCRDSVFQATYAVASAAPDGSGTPAITRGEADAIVEASTAPRVTADAIKAKIASADFFRSGVLTICIIEMVSGFTFVGKSACVSVENYDQAAGERYSYDDAFRQIWAFEAYLLREQLSAATDRVA
ncbi:Gp49 family protein [Methylobacterium sp. E-041]|uniref:Gp49 family protein n=1 Tax=Methylobacterium sp. E-041 TaxID=2836573 RepID=UPI001FB8656F|nr:Gp49 family protein [Methylobacterium sp. E-041]MCJ2107882.1 Gp49 family protein [Methylobacterium sp. E-041]